MGPSSIRETMMNKKELVGALADKTGSSQAAAGEMLSAVLDTIHGELKKGNEVNLPGFGKFIAKHRPSRKARNPITGKEMMTKDKTVAQFRPSSALKEL
ncbi:HU family DNA-binding protein [Litorimonas sp. RW-G-Af-16]|uniref:HU family DNA-binding protein n=1 Tax=Litorimonas sp. RW-G-Af-16 TaxID=3241168 RepID=UPI00390C6DD4